MDVTRMLAERVNAYHAVVERVGLEWATRLRVAADECGSREARVLAEAVCDAIAADGADGLFDMVLAGSSVGGVGHNDAVALVRMVDQRLATHALAA
jgi:hypothetical protein